MTCESCGSPNAEMMTYQTPEPQVNFVGDDKMQVWSRFTRVHCEPCSKGYQYRYKRIDPPEEEPDEKRQ